MTNGQASYGGVIQTPEPFRDYIEAGIAIEGRGGAGEIDTLCPRCSHTRRKSTHRCLSVNLDKGTWICHHCGWRGWIKTDDDWRKEGKAPPKKHVRPTTIGDDPGDTAWQRVVEWFGDRLITKSTLERNRVRAAVAYMPQDDAEMNCIAFPYYRNGQLINVKYRDGHKHFRMVKDAERIFYGLDDLPGHEEVIIVEGEIDKFSMEEAGYLNVLSVPDGAPQPGTHSYASKFDFLRDRYAVALLDQMKRIILAPDRDGPGRELAKELSRRFGPERCFEVEWPEGINDANDCLVKGGSEYLRALVEEARPVPWDGIIRPRDLIKQLDRLYEMDPLDHGKTGYAVFDSLVRIMPGQLSIWTGVPGAGKSIFIDNLVIRKAEMEGWQVAICSPEYLPLERHLAGLISIRTGKPFFPDEDVVIDDEQQMIIERPRLSLEEVHAANAWLDEYVTFIHPEDDMTIDAVLERARIIHMQRGLAWLIIDPYTEMEHHRPPNMTETEYVGRVLSTYRQWGRKYGVHVSMVAHPSKMRSGEEMPIVDVYDISGSAHWANKADCIFSIWRPEEDGEPTEVHVRKVRFSETGRKGAVSFDFDIKTSTFREREKVTR